MSIIEGSQTYLVIAPRLLLIPGKSFVCLRGELAKKWRIITTSTPCATYQEFFEVLLRIEDSENAPDDKDEEDIGKNVQRYNNKGQSSLGLRRAQNFKMSGNSFGSSSGGSNSGTPHRGGRFAGGSRFQNQRNSSSSGVQFCRRCNTRHYEECKR